MLSPTVAVIVVAAGSGSRLGEPLPKAFVAVGGRSMLERTLDEVLSLVPLPEVVVVVPADRVGETERMVEGTHAVIVAGGSTRQESVACGLSAVSGGVEIVLVHDAARALAPSGLFLQVIDQVRRTGHGIVPGLPVVNTIKRVDDLGRVVDALDRSELRAIQTPQGFPRDAFVAAHSRAREEFTDDAALFAAAGHQVSVIPGDSHAFKITTAFDLRRAEHLVRAAAAGDIRIGLGVDVHAFDESRPLRLGGLDWPGEPGLAGHSDGDAVCHAMCDSMLSAAGLGDIGSLFGTHDPRFAQAPGSVFIAVTLKAVHAAGFDVVNVAVQVIANHPKIGARRVELQSVLSALVGAPVSVSATTSDGLGFTGRSEGITAIANCQLRRR